MVPRNADPLDNSRGSGDRSLPRQRLPNQGTVRAPAGEFHRAFAARQYQWFWCPCSRQGLLANARGWLNLQGWWVNDSGVVAASGPNATGAVLAAARTTSGSTGLPLPSGGWTHARGLDVNDSGEGVGWVYNGSTARRLSAHPPRGLAVVPLHGLDIRHGCVDQRLRPDRRVKVIPLQVRVWPSSAPVPGAWGFPWRQEPQERKPRPILPTL
jgi:hypothetical protein